MVEVALSVALFSALLLSFSQAVHLQEAQGGFHSEEVELTIQLNEALQHVSWGMAYSGFTDDGTYPYLCDAGEADGLFEGHAHDAPSAPVTDGDWPSREAVFLLPQDADADGRPDMNGDGEMVWGAEEYAFVVVPDQGGWNRIEERLDGVTQSVVCRNVESMVIDDTASGGPGIPLGCVRVRLVLSKQIGNRVVTRSGETVIRLRNGGIRP